MWRDASSTGSGYPEIRCDWLKVYNQRLSDKWTDRELMHKAEAAASGTYDKPRGWMKSDTETTVLSYSQCSAMVRETVVHAPKYPPKGTKIGPVFTKEACFTTETTVLSESQRGTHTRARANQPHWDWKTTVVTVPKLSPEETGEAQRIAGELVKMHRDGAIKDANDPEAKFYAAVLHTFGGTYTGKRQA